MTKRGPWILALAIGLAVSGVAFAQGVQFGTLTGNADSVAHDLAAAFDLVDFSPTVLDMYDADLAIFEHYQDIVICTSTQGEGDLPPNAEPLHDALATAIPKLAPAWFACGVQLESFSSPLAEPR